MQCGVWSRTKATSSPTSDSVLRHLSLAVTISTTSSSSRNSPAILETSNWHQTSIRNRDEVAAWPLHDLPSFGLEAIAISHSPESGDSRRERCVRECIPWPDGNQQIRGGVASCTSATCLLAYFDVSHHCFEHVHGLSITASCFLYPDLCDMLINAATIHLLIPSTRVSESPPKKQL